MVFLNINYPNYMKRIKKILNKYKDYYLVDVTMYLVLILFLALLFIFAG